MATEKLEALVKTATVPSEITDGNAPITLIKIGRIVTAVIPNISTQNIGAWGTIPIANLPNEYRPSSAVRFPIIRQLQTDTNAVFYLVSLPGVLSLNNQGAAVPDTGAIMQTCITWIAAS